MASELSQMLHLRFGRALRNVPAHHGVDHRRIADRLKQGPPAATPPEERPAWEIPVLQTVAETGQGVPGLLDALDRHRAWLETSGERGRRRRSRMADRVREEVDRRLRRRAWVEGRGDAVLQAALEDLEQGRVTPYDVAARIAGDAAEALPQEPEMPPSG
jgi:LAO/AO transport system kinase